MRRALILVVGLVGVGLVGVFDGLTGAELSFGIFYLIPVAWTAWRATRYEAATMALVAALTWYAIEVTHGRAYSSALVPVWNATVRFGFFILVGLLLSRVRIQLQMVRANNAELNRLNEALDGYAAHVAHDVRSPLATIAMAVNMLSREPDHPDAEFVGMIERSAKRGLDLTEDLLSLAKASATPQREAIDLEHLVRAASTDVDELTVVVDGPLHALSADPVVLRQCLENLFRNASKYARSNGQAAEVTVSSDERPDGWIVSVADRGPGLTADETHAVFDAFTRGTKPEGQGTGLGLAIVSAAAAAHGGRAWYEPRDDGGSIFRLMIRKEVVPSS